MKQPTKKQTNQLNTDNEGNNPNLPGIEEGKASPLPSKPIPDPVNDPVSDSQSTGVTPKTADSRGMGELNEDKPKTKYIHNNGRKLSISKRATIHALYSMGVPKAQIAREEKIARNTVYGVLLEEDYNDKVIAQIKKNFAASWYVNGKRALQHITNEKLDKSNAFQLTTIGAISIDKARLCEGLATVRVDFVGEHDPELDAKIEGLEGELEGWKSGKTVNVEPLESANKVENGG